MNEKSAPDESGKKNVQDNKRIGKEDRVKQIRAMRAKKRRQRRRDVLAFSKKPGFQRRVVNDTPGRVQSFIDEGWAVVHGDETGGETTAADPTKKSSVVSKPVGTGKDGPINAVLMEIPDEIFQEDKAEKQRRIKEDEQNLFTRYNTNPKEYVNQSD